MSHLWDLGHIRPETRSVLTGDTMTALFWHGVAKRGPQVWLRQKHLGLWRSWTWNQTATAVEELCAGLLSLGFAKGECASILSNTVVEWVWADLAILSACGVSNGIYPTDASTQVHYLCEDSRTTVLFVEDDEQLDKALEVRAQLPLLRKIVVFDMEGLRTLDDPDVISLDGLRALGRAQLAKEPDAVRQRRPMPAQRPGDFGVHLRHHRQAQGCHAFAQRPGVYHARLQHPGSAGRARRAHVLFALVSYC